MNNKYNSLPMLRFPEFSGEWTQYKLGECFDERNEQFPESSDYPLMAFIAGKGVTEKGEKYDRSALVKDAPNKKYKRTELGDFIYSSNNLESGSIGLNRYGKACISPVYSIFKAKKGFDPYFIGTILTQKSFISEMIKYRQGVVYGQWKIPEKEFLNLIIRIPSFGEQQRIAEFLEAEDRMIAAQEQKVESLKTHKKGLMQQLFPQPGATTPALRFPGFTGDWQFVNGDKLFEPISNKKHNSDLPILALTQDQGAVPREMINYNVVVSDKSVTGYKVVEVDDFIISLRSFQGGIEYSRYKGLCSPAYIVLRKKDKTLSSDFYRIYFKSFNYIQNLNKNLEGIRDGKMISYQQFSEIMLPLPTANEQIMIANCISSLDEVILLESQKLESLKTHKKGLMQQLFPQPVK